jgi:hypothetical protein
MTIKELYEWATDAEFENYEIEIQYRDGGGYYSGTDFLTEEDIDVNVTKQVVIL